MTTNKKIELTERDEKLFKYLFANKGATIRQINRDVFPDTNERRVYRRTQKLRDFGLIQTNIHFDRVQFGVLNVTKKGLRCVYDLGKDITSREITSGNLKHDIILLDLKNMLSKIECFDFYGTENEIESGLIDSEIYPIEACKDLHSDALLGIKWNNKNINFAIEYENSEKTTKRYYEYLSNYYAYPAVHNVLYFTKDEKIKRRILNSDKKIIENLDNKTSKIFVTNLEDLRKPITTLKTFNSSGDYLEFKWSEEIYL